MRQRGAMYEIHLTLWPVLYGYAGWLWGTELGWPVAGAIGAVVAGFAVGMAVMTVNPYSAMLSALWLLAIVPWFVEAEAWRWTVLALCLLPLPMIVAGLVLKEKGA